MVRISSHSKRKGIQSGNQFVSIAIPTHFYHYWQTAFILPSLSEEVGKRRHCRAPYREIIVSNNDSISKQFLFHLLFFKLYYHLDASFCTILLSKLMDYFLTRLQLIFLNLHKIFLILWRSYIRLSHRKHSPSPTRRLYWWDPSAKPRVQRFTYFELFAKVPISPSCSAARWAPAQECGLTSRTNCRWVIFTQFLIPTQPSADLLMQLFKRTQGIARTKSQNISIDSSF